MDTKEIKSATSESATTETNEKKFKYDKNRFELCLYVNDFLICKRNFPIYGFIERSMKTSEFKSAVDRIVELIQKDLKSKSRVYTWYHNVPEHPDWDPEVMTNPLSEEGENVFKFVILDNGVEVISRIWDGRYYPTYVRKNVDLTNRQVKITKNEQTYIYDKESFFENNENQLFGELYTLKGMIMDKVDLIPTILKEIYDECSSQGDLSSHVSDGTMCVEYRNRDYKRDENGEPILDGNGTTVEVRNLKTGEVVDNVVISKGNYVFEDVDAPSREYWCDIKAYNNKINSEWGMAVADKTKAYWKETFHGNSKKKTYTKKNS